MKKLVYFCALATMIGSFAFADPISLTFVTSSIATTGGTTVTFQATGLNTTGALLNLNSDSFSITSPLTLNDSAFFNIWPLTLDAGQSFGPADIFDITVPLATPLSDYTGTFNILGGPGPNDTDLLATATFDVNVAAPEPGGITLAMVGIGMLLALRAARQARRRNA